ncbi:MAG: RDD family protein [Defluviitaleaceae bacterium]|nr:RDD family protein [Defluviitaleaceae bacterium]
MIIIKRIIANIIDIVLFFFIIVMFFMFILPFFLNWAGIEGELSPFLAGVSLVLIITLNFAIQYLFLQTHQTIGKAFFGLKIVSTNAQRPLTVSIVLQREILAKAMTCYLMCIPVLFGREGKHDEACETKVI